ncbi:hypothetical protein CLCR_05877 [Cladophialophora carrionii]|uniref:Uncharacterized protein n=1 Tax=Cladophialophora carrionii TaxID=86049 RepID=A0A1C1C736_9EURO|nr:hypothetical protein CLCR_05877 [Cladophialophora carrionii]
MTGREVSTLTDPRTVRYDPLEVIPAKILYIPPLTTNTECDPVTGQSFSSTRPQAGSALTVDHSRAGQSQDWQPGNHTVSCTSTDVSFSTHTSPWVSLSATQTNAGHKPEPASATIVTCCNTSIPPTQGFPLPSWRPPPLFSFDISSSLSLSPTSTTTVRVRTTTYVTRNVTVSGPPLMQTHSGGEYTSIDSLGSSMTKDTNTDTNTSYGPIGSFTVSPIPHAGPGGVSTISPPSSASASASASATLSTTSTLDIASPATRTTTLVKTVIVTASPAVLAASSSSAPVGSVTSTESSFTTRFQAESSQISRTTTSGDVSPDTAGTRTMAPTTMPDPMLSSSSSPSPSPRPSEAHVANTSIILSECSIVFGTSTPETCTLGPPAVTVHASQGGGGGGGGRRRHPERRAEAEAYSNAGQRPVTHTVVVLTLWGGGGADDGRMAPQASTLRTVPVAETVQ